MSEDKDLDIINDIKEVIYTLRPYLRRDGGDMEFVKYEEGVVYIRLLAACASCPIADVTLYDGVENALKQEIPQVKKVVQVKD